MTADRAHPTLPLLSESGQQYQELMTLADALAERVMQSMLYENSEFSRDDATEVLYFRLMEGRDLHESERHGEECAASETAGYLFGLALGRRLSMGSPV